MELGLFKVMKRIIKHYYSGNKVMDRELCAALNIYKQYMNGAMSSIHAGLVTEEDVLRRCFTGNHYHLLHLTSTRRKALTQNAINALKKKNILSFRGGDFETLYQEVKNAIGGLPQVGNLVLYDTTKMIGYILTPRISPMKYVYVQSGAKVGAKNLLGIKRMGMRYPTSAFKKFFPKVDSIHIEDMLCIYKNYFTFGGVIPGTHISFFTKSCSPKRKMKQAKSCVKKIVP